jgi:SAM-dependent methyltransferase
MTATEMPQPKHYDGEKGRQYHGEKRGIHPAALPWVQRARAEKFQSYIQSSDRVFEFGAGAGWNLAKLTCSAKFAWDVSEFLKPDLQKLGIQFLSPDAIADGSIDAVICHHVLEHLLNPVEALTIFQRILKPGGRLWISVPFEIERRYRYFNPAEPNHHLYSWNAQTLGNLVLESGFKIDSIEVKPFGYDRFAANMAVKLHLGESGFRAIRSLAHLLRPLREVQIRARPA